MLSGEVAGRKRNPHIMAAAASVSEMPHPMRRIFCLRLSSSILRMVSACLAAGPSLEKRWGVKGAELADRMEVWEMEAWYIGQAITNYIMILSPERIICGGGVMHQPCLLPLIRKEVERQMNGYIKGKGMDDLENYIVGVSLNDNQGAMGAVKLAMDALAEKEAN